MKSLHSIGLAILMALFIGSTSIACANVLTNPGFESGLTGWTGEGYNISYAGGSWAAHSGTKAGVINADGGTGRLYQEISGVNSGDRVNFLGWNSGSQDLASTASAFMAIEFYNGGTLLSGGSNFSKSGPYAYQLNSLVSYAPALTTKARAIVGLSGGSGVAGCGMFDDLDASVTVIPEPTSMLLLGSGLLGLFGIGRKRK